MNWYLDVVKKYAVFGGRARRKEYWMFFLFNLIIAVVLNVVGAIAHFPAIGALYTLAVLLPSLAVAVRRLHDTGRSGWWLLIGFVPLFGALALLYFFVSEGEPNDNAYGPNPKAAAA